MDPTSVTSSQRRYDTSRIRLIGLTLALLPLAPARPAALLPGGDFESGSFFGWTPGGVQGGVAFVAAQHTCFSANDTTGIQFSGNFAAAIRPSGEAPSGSIGTLTSAPFKAGEGIAWHALAEASAGDGLRPNFEVSILDSDGVELITVPYSTSLVGLSAGCPSEPRNRAFSTHYLSTTRFRGDDIRVQFRVAPGKPGQGNFVLVDRVVMFDEGEAPLFRSQPVAVAGTSVTSNSGILMLDGSLSFDPDGQELTYEWFFDGDVSPRRGRRVCVPDLAPGTNTAVTLFVSDGFHTSSDTMLIGVPEAQVDGVVVSTEDFNRGDPNADRSTGRQLFDPECAEEDEGLLFPEGPDNGTGDNATG